MKLATLIFLGALVAIAQPRFPISPSGISSPNATATLGASGTVLDIPHTFSAEATPRAVITCYTALGALITSWTRTDPDANTIRITFGSSQGIGTQCNANATGTGPTGPTGASGESLTATNTGSAGVGIFKSKVSLDLQFYRIASANNLLTIALSGTDFLQMTINRDNFNWAASEIAYTPGGSIGGSNVAAAIAELESEKQPLLGFTPESQLTFSSPITRVSNTISIPAATGSVNGYLTSSDHTLFSGKYGPGASPTFDDITATSNIYKTGVVDGCATWNGGSLISTSVPCGTGEGGGGGGEANTTADVGTGLSLRGSTPKTGTALNIRTLAATAPLGVTQNSDLITFAMPVAASGVSGYLSSTDWASFTAKESPLTFTAPLDRSSNTISMAAATSSLPGYLTAADWTTFNSKAAGSHTHTAANVTDFNATALTATAGAYQPLDSDLTAFAGKTAPASVVVGTTDPQTLDNKILNSPVINTPTGITKADVGLALVPNIDPRDRSTHTGTQLASTISDLSTAVGLIFPSAVTYTMTGSARTITYTAGTPTTDEHSIEGELQVVCRDADGDQDYAANRTTSVGSGNYTVELPAMTGTCRIASFRSGSEGGGGGGGGESNVTADVGGGLSLRGSTPKVGVALNIRTIAATGPLTASNSSDLITFAMPAAASGVSGYLSSADWATFNGKQAALGFTAENAANKGAASGYASLDSGTKVPIAQIPTGTTSTTVSLGNHAHAATAVTNAPAGSIAATTVQAAIDELATEKQASLGFTAENAANKGATNGYASLVSGTVPISQVPTGTTSTTVSLGNHVHAASAVTNTPAGNIGSTTVQTAINELDTEKAALSHAHAAADTTSGTFANARIASSNVTQHQASLAIGATQITAGELSLTRGGTNQNAWTAARCVQVSADGTKLESAASACADSGSLNGSLTHTFGVIEDGSCATPATVVISGAVAGEIVAAGWPASVPVGVFGSARVVAAGTGEIQLCNLSGAQQTIGSATYLFRVIR